MKSFRLLAAVLAVAAFANSRAADPQKAAGSASPAAKASASPKATPDNSGLPDPVAIVDGKKIKRSELEDEFNTQVKAMGVPLDSITADQKQKAYHKLLEVMVTERLLKARAESVKMSDDEMAKAIAQFKQDQNFTGTDAELDTALVKIGRSLEKLKENIRVEKWIDLQTADQAKVSDDEAKAFYDAHPDDFQTIRVSHILIMVPKDATPEVADQKEKLAKSIKERITKGEDFAKVAGEVSEDPDSKAKGGDLVQFFPRGSMRNTLPEFEEAAFKLKKGEISDPVKTALGWHIIKVTDQKMKTFDETKPDIVEYLGQQKQEKAIDALLTSLREKNAKIFLPPLPKAPAVDDEAQLPGEAPNPAAPQKPTQNGGAEMERAQDAPPPDAQHTPEPAGAGMDQPPVVPPDQNAPAK